MYTLYTSWGSGGFAVQAVLEEAGLKYRLEHVDTKAGAHRAAEFLKISPLAQVPVLGLGGGKFMTESAAMIIYLTDRHPEAGLAPTPDAPARAAFLRWMTYMAVNLYTADLRYFYADRYTTDPKGAEAVKAKGLQDMEAQFTPLEVALEGKRYLVGNRYSAADPYLVMLAHWHPQPDKVFKACPNIKRLCETVKKRRAVALLNEVHKVW